MMSSTSSGSGSIPSAAANMSALKQQQAITQNAIIQQVPLGKLSGNDQRLQPSSSSGTITAIASSASGTTPSLVVSVPLSTATVPGVNLPPSTSATIIQLNQMQNYHQQNVSSGSHRQTTADQLSVSWWGSPHFAISFSLIIPKYLIERLKS